MLSVKAERWTSGDAYDKQGGGNLAERKKREVNCEVIFTEGAVDRITQAFVDLYYGIQDGLYQYNGPSLHGKKKQRDESV